MPAVAPVGRLCSMRTPRSRLGSSPTTARRPPPTCRRCRRARGPWASGWRRPLARWRPRRRRPPRQLPRPPVAWQSRRRPVSRRLRLRRRPCASTAAAAAAAAAAVAVASGRRVVTITWTTTVVATTERSRRRCARAASTSCGGSSARCGTRRRSARTTCRGRSRSTRRCARSSSSGSSSCTRSSRCRRRWLLHGPKWPSWQCHSWPLRAPQNAPEGLRRCSAVMRRGPAPQIPPRGRGPFARGRQS